MAFDKKRFFGIKLRKRDYTVPDTEQKLELRGLRHDVARAWTQSEGRGTADLIINGAFDPETGKPAFDEGDVMAMNVMPCHPLEPMAHIILELSGLLGGQDGGIAKNSPPTPKPAS